MSKNLIDSINSRLQEINHALDNSLANHNAMLGAKQEILRMLEIAKNSVVTDVEKEIVAEIDKVSSNE